MGIFTKFLADDDQGNTFYLLRSTIDAKDAVVVEQDKLGRIRVACLCGPSGSCTTPSAVYHNIWLAGYSFWSVEKPQIGGETEAFLREQEKPSVQHKLDAYYAKKNTWDHHYANKEHFGHKVDKIAHAIEVLKDEIAKLEAQIPEAQECVQEHERILAEGEPVIPMLDVVRLDSLLVGSQKN